MDATGRRPLARVFALTAACLAAGAAHCSPIARATPIGGVEHFPTKCDAGSLAAGPDGNVWFTCFRGSFGAGGQGVVGRITPQGNISEFSSGIPTGIGVGGIVAGADGNLWFSASAGVSAPLRKGHPAAIGRITPAGVVTLFRTGLRGQAAPGQLTPAPGGDLWFIDGASPPEIGRITPEGTITEFPTEVKPPLGLGGLAAGPDGNIWFTQVFVLPSGNGTPGGLIGRLTPSGAVTLFGAAPAASGAPVAGPDGNVWFVGAGRHLAIDRVTPNGEITQFGTDHVGVPSDLVAGPDGNLWFTAQQSINRVTPSGEITQFTDCMDYREFFSEATSIVAGPGHDLWFASATSRSLPAIEEPPTIGQVTPSGEITLFKAGIDSQPQFLLAGPDGRLWFTGGGQEIERITPPSGPVNTFILAPGRAKANGASELAVEVPGPGTIELHQLALVLPHRRTIRLPSGDAVRADAATCGPALLKLRLRGAARARIRRKGQATIKVRTTFTPTGGSANTEVRTIRLRKPPHRH